MTTVVFPLDNLLAAALILRFSCRLNCLTSASNAGDRFTLSMNGGPVMMTGAPLPWYQWLSISNGFAPGQQSGVLDGGNLYAPVIGDPANCCKILAPHGSTFPTGLLITNWYVLAPLMLSGSERCSPQLCSASAPRNPVPTPRLSAAAPG